MRTVIVVVLDLAMLAVGGYLIVTSLGASGDHEASAGAAEVARALEPAAIPAKSAPTESSDDAQIDDKPASKKRRRTANPSPSPAQPKRAAAESTKPAPSEARSPEPPKDDKEEGGSPASAGVQAGSSGQPPAEGDAAAAVAESTTDAPQAVASDADVKRIAGRISRVVGGNQVALSRCYQRAAKGYAPDKPLQGRIDVRLTVLPQGSAINVRPVGNDTGSEVLATCLVGLLQKWQFPGHSYEPIDFVWPFVFQPPKT